MRSAIAAVALLAATVPALAAEAPYPVVAAQAFYGEVVSAIGGDSVIVESVVVSADADPHDFEPPASVARAVADAAIVVMNGADYDHWMERLVESSEGSGRIVIDVAELLGVGEEDNPHLWYDPRAMPAVADAVVDALSTLDPGGAEGYRRRADSYVTTLDAMNHKIADIRARYAGTPVTASEPVFGPMAAALGLDMRNEDFQQAIMHETEPSAARIAAMQDDLRSGAVKVFFYNSQVVDPLTEQLLAIAREAGVPVVGVTESMPPDATYAGWMVDQLEATEKALSAPAS